MKQFWWCFLWLFLIKCPTLISQNPFLDSLKMAVDTMPNSEEKVKVLSQITLQLYSGEEAVKFAQKAIQEANLLNNEKLVADAWKNLAGYYSIIRNVDSFDIAAEKAEYYYRKMNDHWGQAYMHKLRGHLMGTFKQNEAAKESFQKAIFHGEKTDHARLKMSILHDYGLFLKNTENYQEAEKKFLAAIKIYEKANLNDPAGLARVYLHLGNIYQNNQQFDDAIDFTKKAYSITKKLNFLRGIAETQIKLLMLKTEIDYTSGDTTNFYKTINELGYINAFALLDSLEVTAKKMDSHLIWESFYKISYEYYKRYKNYEKALHYYVISDQIEDSLLLDQKNIQALADLELKYNNEVLQNDLLRTQISETETTNQRNVLLFSLFAALSIGILGVLFFRQRLEARNIALQLEEQKVKELERQQQLVAMNAMLEGQEKERSRIAKDLHDGLGNMLTSIKFQIAGLPLGLDNNFKKVQGKAENMIDEACSEVRKIAHNMMPIALKKLGLTRALEDLCEKHQAHQSYEVIFQIFGREARFNANVETMLYRIAQEIFNNINKHAEATEIVVQMTYSEEWLNLTFEDNGKGFDKQKIMKSGGLGLHSIQSRATYLSGECLIDARPDKGTNISINIPINSSNLTT